MTEDPTIIRMNISHYRAVLKLGIDEEKRSLVERLLAGAMGDLMLATNPKNQE